LSYDFGASRYSIEGGQRNVLATREHWSVPRNNRSCCAPVTPNMSVIQTQQLVVRSRENNVRVLTQELRAARESF